MNEEKQQYVANMARTFESVRDRLEQFRERLKSSSNKQRANLKGKFQNLEERVNQLGWRIENFRKSRTRLDDGVKRSFDELIEEISWRMKEVELAFEGKELWEIQDGFDRGGRLFE